MNNKNCLRDFIIAYKSDIILVIAVLVIGGVALFVQHTFSKTGYTVSVVLDGDVIESHSLDTDYTGRITAGDGYNVLVIEDHMASISEADCSEQICVKHTGINKKGETIVCLPHRLVIQIQ